MYGNEQYVRRRGRFIAPVFQANPNGFDMSKWCELQCHFMQLRGCDTMNCNINDGNMQRHLVGVHGYGMRYYNAILWVFVGTGTINRPLRLRGGRGKTWVNGAINNKMGNAKYINEHIMCGLFIAQIYINEHSAIFIYCANVWQRTHRKA